MTYKYTIKFSAKKKSNHNDIKNFNKKKNKIIQIEMESLETKDEDNLKAYICI